MRKRLSGALLLFTLLVVGTTQLAIAQSAGSKSGSFSASLSPARRVYELHRGEETSYNINFSNNSDVAADNRVKISIGDFYYDINGNQAFLDPESTVNLEQSLQSWITVPKEMSVAAGKGVSVPIKLKVPNDADFGDHMAAIFLEKPPQDAGGDLVAIRGRLASIIIVKVLGGPPEVRKGEVKNFDILTREKARNTVTFSFDFLNSGREFFSIAAEVNLYDKEGDSKPFKTINYGTDVFPNAKKNIKIPLGDLGDEYGEKEYYAELTVRDPKPADGKPVIFGVFKKAFYYYLPALVDSPAVPEIQKNSTDISMAALIQAFREFGIYIGGFIIVLIVLIKILFFSSKEEPKKGRRK